MPHRLLGLLAFGLAVATLAACGGDDNDTPTTTTTTATGTTSTGADTTTSTTKTSTTASEPTSTMPSCKARAVDLPARLKFALVKRSTKFVVKVPARGLDASMTVEQVSSRKVIRNSNKRRPVQVKPKNGRFVILTVRVTNNGSKKFPAPQVAALIVLKQSGKTYGMSARCAAGGIYAADVGVAGPRDVIRAGETREVGGIYVIPRKKGQLEGLVLRTGKKVLLET